MALSSVQLAYIIGSCILFLVMVLVLVILVKTRFKNPDEEDDCAQPPTLIRYWKHEHPVLSILWSGPTIRGWPQYYMIRRRRIIVFAVFFFLHFTVAGIIYSMASPFTAEVDCVAARKCWDECVGCEMTDFQVGPDEELTNFRLPRLGNDNETGTSDLNTYEYCTSGNTDSGEIPCWWYCVGPDTSSREETRDLVVDQRPFCEETEDPEEARWDLVCLNPDGILGCQEEVGANFTLGGVTVEIPTEFNYEEMGIRILLTVVIVLPLTHLLKSLMRFIHNSKHNACGVCRRFVGSFLVTIVLLVSVVVAIILGSSFRQGVLGQFLIGFLTSFGTGLLIDFPKLAALYFIYKKSILIKRYNFVKEIEREVAEEKARIAAEGGKRKKKGKKKDKKKKKQARTRRAPSLSSTEPLRRAPEMSKKKSKKKKKKKGGDPVRRAPTLNRV